MKHKKLYLTISFLISIFSLSFCSSATAWLNAPINTVSSLRACGTVAQKQGRDPVEFYREHYNMENDPYNHFYGTHDFIAHYAIKYLCRSYPIEKYFWLNDLSRRYSYIYLLATEYPDYVLAPSITLDCGKSTNIKNDFDGGESHQFSGCKSTLIKRASKVYEALRKKNSNNELKPWYETVAFYIGAVTHYIDEQAHPHHASNIGTIGYHQWLEREVSKFTTLEAFQNNNGFFNINLERILKWNILDGFKRLTPGIAMDQLAQVTINNEEVLFDGTRKNGSQNAQYFYDFYSKDCGNGYGCWNSEFENVGRDGSLFPPQLLYLADNFKNFFDRIEELLNWAVYFTACAISFMLKELQGPITPCQNDDGDDNNPKPTTDDSRNPPFETVDFIARYGALIAAFVAVGLVGRKFVGRF